MFKGMEKFEKLSGWNDVSKTLVYAGSDTQNRVAGKVIPWKTFGVD